MKLTLRQRIDFFEKLFNRMLEKNVNPVVLKYELDKIGEMVNQEKDDNEVEYAVNKIVEFYAKLSIAESKKQNVEEMIVEIDNYKDAMKVTINSMVRVPVKVLHKVLKQYDETYYKNIEGIGFKEGEIFVSYKSDKKSLIVELHCDKGAIETQKEFLEFLKIHSNL